MKIREKLYHMNAIMTRVAVVVGTVASVVLLVSGYLYQTALKQYGYTQGDIGILLSLLYRDGTEIRDIFLLSDIQKLDVKMNELVDNNIQLNGYLQKIEENLAGDEEGIFQQLQEAVEEYRVSRYEVISLGLANQNEAALNLFQGQSAVGLEECIGIAGELMDRKVQKGRTVSMALSIGGVSMAVLFVVFVLYGIYRVKKASVRIGDELSDSLEQLTVAADTIARGEIKTGITVRGEGEVRELADTFSLMTGQLHTYIDDITQSLKSIGGGNLKYVSSVDYMGDFQEIASTMQEIVRQLGETMAVIRETAENVAAFSKETSKAGAFLEVGTEKQQQEVERLTEILTASAAKVETNRQKTEGIMGNVTVVVDEIDKSKEKMQQLLDAVGEISSASGNIQRVIGSIEEIAQQTNLLSLNASIEAARAGDAGKGFAVVALEIGSLAKQCIEAAKNTRQLIENSNKAVSNGNEIAAETNGVLQEMMKGLQEIVSYIGFMSEFSGEQAKEMPQLLAAVEQIGEVVKDNSATAMENAASGEELQKHSYKLKELVDKFVV